MKISDNLSFEQQFLILSNMNNETIGMSAEKAICDLCNLENSIGENRYNDNILIKIFDSNLMDVFNKKNIWPKEHIGGENGKTDFICNDDKTLSLKTLKKNDGKICPQEGQPTYKSFHTHNPSCPIPDKNCSRVEANTIRWNWIKSNIGDYLNKMQKQTFCCDYLLLIRNCETKPKAEILKNNNIDFNNIIIEYTNETYKEEPHKKKIGELTEFGCTVKGIIDSEKKRIGEFQFHYKSRSAVKFRFYNSLFN
tara:strand:- start:762 stop:1517 length:756 start_codon:yes stop_codon:yes gene_type:complete